MKLKKVSVGYRVKAIIPPEKSGGSVEASAVR